MNTSLIRLALAVTALASVLLALACGGGSQNSNNVNQNSGNANSAIVETASLIPDPVCQSGTIDEKRLAVDTKIHEAIRNQYSKLQKQLDKGTLKIEVFIYGSDSLDVYVEGRLKGKGQMGNLAGVINPFLTEGCVQRVWLVPAGTYPFTTKAPPAPIGFLWMGCEEGTKPCPNGSCIPDGDTCPGGTGNANVPDKTPTPAGNGNSNSNSGPPSISHTGNMNG